MRRLHMFCLAAGLALASTAAHAAEEGQTIRAGDLMSEPFIDAGKAAKVKAGQDVTILERKGGWLKVQTAGQTGWVRSLNVRLEEGGARPRGGDSSAVSLLRTGSSGKTVATGVKGVGEEDIRKAAPDYAQLAELDTLAVDDADARATAQANKLPENRLDYFRESR